MSSSIAIRKQIIRETVQSAMRVFTASHFMAEVEVHGTDSEGREFYTTFVFDNQDPEFLQMLNDYGARKSAALL